MTLYTRGNPLSAHWDIPGEDSENCADCGLWIYECTCNQCPDCGEDKDGPHWVGCQLTENDETINEALAPKRRAA